MYKVNHSRLSVSTDSRCFTKSEQPFFYLADTVWSLFTNCSGNDLPSYLKYRKKQGFNVLQINILPQWDRSCSLSKSNAVHPFPMVDGKYTYQSIHEDYFDKVEQFLSLIVQSDFTPSLVLLWGNYVKGTWMSSHLSGRDDMPQEFMEEYVEYVVNRFKKFHPVYMISGDTDFSADATACYHRALSLVKKYDPDTLCTFHLNPDADLPDIICQDPNLDFYMFQSGHDLMQENPCKLAEKFASYPVKRPVVNGEPCYEGLNVVNQYRRFSQFDVRKAAWQSVLAGALAGIAYGAHGLWNWHRPGDIFDGGNAFIESFYWDTAVYFHGAADYGWLKTFIMEHRWSAMTPVAITDNCYPGIRTLMAEDGRFIMYIPCQELIEININLCDYQLKAIALEDHREIIPHVRTVSGNMSEINLMRENSDVILAGRHNV